MSYFDFKLNSLYIKNNRDINKAEISIFSFITNGETNQDLFNGLLEATTTEAKKEIIKQGASELLAKKQMRNIQNIPDNFKMNFGMNGISLYRSKVIPEYFDWSFAVFDSDEKIRQFGQKVDNFVNSPTFNLFANNIVTLIGAAATPQIFAAIKVSELVARFVAQEMMQNEDDQICVYAESFNRYENYPNLNLKGVDIEDMTGNCRVSYSIFGKE